MTPEREIARLRGAIGRALLTVTVSGLTAEGYKNTCAQARDILRAAQKDSALAVDNPRPAG